MLLALTTAGGWAQNASTPADPGMTIGSSPVEDKSVKGPDGNPYDAHKMVKPMELGGKTA